MSLDDEKQADSSQSGEGRTAGAKTCPSCSKDLLAKALKCRYCGHWLPETMSPPEQVVAAAKAEFAATAAGQADSTAVPADAPTANTAAEPAASDYRGETPWHLVMLSLSTLGFYHLLWFWRNWCYIRDETPKDIDVRWRTAGAFVIVVNWYLLFAQLRDILTFAEQDGEDSEGPSYYPIMSTVAYFGLIHAGTILGNPFVLLAAVVPLIPVQQVLNRYWERKCPDAPVRTSLTRDDVVFVLAAIVLQFTIAMILRESGLFSQPSEALPS